jgi:hypothetical protein
MSPASSSGHDKQSSSSKRKEEIERLLEELRQEFGFVHQTNFSADPISSPIPITSGPKISLPSTDGLKEGDVFNMFYSELLIHMLRCTNDRFRILGVLTDHRQKNNFSITLQELINYLACYFALGVIGRDDWESSWESDDKSEGILGNPFIKSTLSKYKFRKINRNLSAKLEFVRDYVNVTSQRYYSPTINLSADDQLQKWKG